MANLLEGDDPPRRRPCRGVTAVRPPLPLMLLAHYAAVPWPTARAVTATPRPVDERIRLDHLEQRAAEPRWSVERDRPPFLLMAAARTWPQRHRARRESLAVPIPSPR
jgi:hypothetical protein